MNTTTSNEKPTCVEQLGVNTWSFNYLPNQNEAGWHYDQLLFNHRPTRAEVINRVIQERYPSGEENAIQRKGIVDAQNDEFIAYLQFVEQVKANVMPEDFL